MFLINFFNVAQLKQSNFKYKNNPKECKTNVNCNDNHVLHNIYTTTTTS